MWHHLFNGLTAALEPGHLLVILVGTVAGLVIGALPGLSAVSGVALLLPFTFSMEPAQGLIMLAAVYMAAEYGGSISAILINTPGTSGAACTVIDGTPLTRKGQAQEALYTSLLAGTVGGLFGALILVFFTPPLARASLFLGPAEIFWIAVSGLFLVASLSGRQTVKGLIGVVLGLAITLVGQDPNTGDMRFTFGQYWLVGGIPLVPALLGLFAVASILSLVETPNAPVAPLTLREGALRFVVDKLLGMKWLLAWSSILGTLIGIVPGAGASISAFVAYGEAKRMSRHPEDFGKGSYEGVAAPECANNAVVGGSLVPLLALGIPGSGSAAIMFGALTVHGIIPGPRLFAERADIVYTFMMGLLATVVAMLVVGLVTIRWSSLIVRVPRKTLVPAVLVLSVIGTYGLSNSLFDVYVLLAIGFLGYLLTKLDVPVVTIALGLVLGSIVEESFQQAVIVGTVDEGSVVLYFLTRPLAILLMLLAFGILAAGIRDILKQRRMPAGPAVVEQHDVRGITLRTANLLLSSAIIGLAIFIHWQAVSLSDAGGLFPRLVADAFLLLGAILLAVNLHPRTGVQRSRHWPFADVPWIRVLLIGAGLLLLAIGAGYIGFYESELLFLLFAYVVLSHRNSDLLRALGIGTLYSVGFTAATYAAFDLVLGIVTPNGLLL